MKPKDLYARKAERTSFEPYGIQEHIPEVDFENIPESANLRVKIHYYKDVCYDGSRTWTLASVSLDGEFFMITQDAGREGRDFSRRIITNTELYYQMVDYFRSIDTKADWFQLEEFMFGEDADIEDLTSFYNDKL